jgi:predicted NAD-dependent protein-ADP-ribosyltransferase YbiA (DUF1768 family)
MSAEKPSEKPTEKPSEKPTEKPNEKLTKKRGVGPKKRKNKQAPKKDAVVDGRLVNVIDFNFKVGWTVFSNFRPGPATTGPATTGQAHNVEEWYQLDLLADEESRRLFRLVMDCAGNMTQPDFAALLARLKKNNEPSKTSLAYWTFEQDGVQTACVAVLAKMMANALKPSAKNSARKWFNHVIMETLGVNVSAMKRGEEKTAEEKKEIMIEAMWPKYYNTELGELLLDTNDAYLMEFGRGSKPTSLWTAKIDKETDEVVGQNLCGKCLMAVREKLRCIKHLSTKLDDDQDAPPKKVYRRGGAHDDVIDLS